MHRIVLVLLFLRIFWREKIQIYYPRGPQYHIRKCLNLFGLARKPSFILCQTLPTLLAWLMWRLLFKTISICDRFKVSEPHPLIIKWIPFWCFYYIDCYIRVRKRGLDFKFQMQECSSGGLACFIKTRG